MPKVLLDHERKKDYAKWIGSIYDRLQMEDEEFVQYVVHFVKKSQSKTVEDYRCFTEGSVKNWIQDNYPPVDVCSFLCFATLEYDSFVKENPKVPAKPLDQANTGNAVAYLDLTLNERNCRYDYVKECMWKYLQMRLYCRNLQDALMIQVVRGIFSFHELKSVKDACEQIIKGISISKAEKEQLAQQIVTESISRQMEDVDSKAAFEKLVVKNAKYFAVGNATVGKRLKKICEDKNKEVKGYSFKKAVSIYAPRCKETYDRTYAVDLCVARDWLIELSYKLSLTVEEINTVLETAGMYRTTEQEIYELFEKLPYGKVHTYTLKQKAVYALMMTAYLIEYKNMIIGEDMLPPIDYLVDYFWDNGGEAALDDAEESLKMYYPAFKMNERNVKRLLGILENAIDKVADCWGSYDESSILYKRFKESFIAYYHAPEKKRKQGVNAEELDLFYFLASFTYSLFLGKMYKGTYTKEDDAELLELFGGVDSPFVKVYRFFNNLFFTFLGNHALNMRKGLDGKCEFYVTINGKDCRAFSMENLLFNFYAAWVCFNKK